MDVHERWVIRHRLPDGRATDVIGWIEGITDTHWSVRDRADQLTVIERAEVVAARRVPAAPGGSGPARTSPAELEQIALTGWVAAREPLGEWTLRAGGGFTGRANSCLAVGDPEMPVLEAAARIIGYALEHGIEPRAQVIHGSEPEAQLRAMGWSDACVATDVLTARLSAFLGPGLPNDRVAVTEVFNERWLAAYRVSRPNPADPALLRQILDGNAPRAFAAVSVDGDIIGIGRAHVRAEWLGLASIWTAPEHRGQGWATALMRVLGHWAARRSARNVYLQVAAANTGAHQAYARLGFSKHHSYLYLAPPADIHHGR